MNVGKSTYAQKWAEHDNTKQLLLQKRRLQIL
jgi:hypothetical protein